LKPFHADPQHRTGLVAALVLAGAIVGLYLPALSHEFVWLDHPKIVEGALIVDDLRAIPDLLVHGRDFAGYHRPIYALMHSLDRALWGLEPFGFHLSSLVLHVMNALGVFVLARKLGDCWSTSLPTTAPSHWHARTARRKRSLFSKATWAHTHATRARTSCWARPRSRRAGRRAPVALGRLICAWRPTPPIETSCAPGWLVSTRWA